MQTLNALPRFLLVNLFLGATLCATSASAAPSASAEPSASADEGVGESARCISLPLLRNVKILDRQHIAFELNNHLVYVNTLPRPCPGLTPNKAILYKPTLNQLCNVDLITVLESFGSGFFQGASCGLGKFEPMSKADGAAVLGKKPRGPRY